MSVDTSNLLGRSRAIGRTILARRSGRSPTLSFWLLAFAIFGSSLGLAWMGRDALFPPAPERIALSNGRFALFAPAKDRQSPLIIFLHAGGGSADESFKNSTFASAARRAGLNIAFGNSQDGFWRYDGYNGTLDHSDDSYVLELRDELLARGYGARGVHLVGASMGGMIALQAACANAARFAGVTIVVSGMPAAVGEKCRELPRRVVAVVGEADDIIPIAGGSGRYAHVGPFWGLERLGAFLRQQRGCARFESPGGADGRVAPSVVMFRAVDCRQAGKTELYRVVDAGHTGVLSAMPADKILAATMSGDDEPTLLISGR